MEFEFFFQKNKIGPGADLKIGNTLAQKEGGLSTFSQWLKENAKHIQITKQ